MRKVELQAPTKEELTKELQESIDWMRAVIPNFNLKSPVMAAKLQRSAKRLKTKVVTPAKSFADVA